MVNTGGSGKQNLNFIIDFVLRYVVWLFGWTPTAYAENLMTTIDDNDRSIHYWHPKSKKVTPKPWTQDEGVAKKVLEEMEKDTGVGMYGIWVGGRTEHQLFIIHTFFPHQTPTFVFFFKSVIAKL